MNRRRTAIQLVAACAVALILTSCGGDDSDDGAPTTEQREAIARANANCRQFERDVRKLGRGVLSNPDFFEATTEMVVAPSIPLLRDIATRQQALIPAVDDQDYELYATLYDPVIVLAQDRLRSGRADDPKRAREVEEQLLDLGLEQVDAARAAGLLDCDEDFQYILQNSFTP